MIEPNAAAGDWTVASLKELLESKLRGLSQRVDDAFTSSKEAIGKADTAIEKRFEGVNEFRQTLADQATTFASKSQTDVRFEQIVTRISAIELQLANAGGKSSVADPQIAQLIIEMRATRTALDQSVGKSTGVGMLWAIILAVAGPVISVVAIAISWSSR